MKSNGKETNELFFFRPHPKNIVDDCILDESIIECVKPNISGKPPIPRCEHSATLILNKYLVIYGGVNESLKDVTGQKCVNDIVLLNLHIYQWETLTSFGDYPEGRWNISLYSLNNRIILFGGMSESGESDEKLYILDIIVVDSFSNYSQKNNISLKKVEDIKEYKMNI